MVRYLFAAAYRLGLLLPLIALLPACTMDVSADPKYQHGWVPGRQYELRRPMALVHDTGQGKVYFEPGKEDQSLGTVLGGINGHDQVLVEHAPAGTRFQVDKLIRDVNPIMTVTVPEGRILSGPHRGSLVELFTISSQDRIGSHELVDRRDDDLAAPVQPVRHEAR